MTDGINASIGVRVTATDTKAPPVGGASQQVNLNAVVAYSAGNAAAGLADKMFTVDIDIAASSALNIDVTTALDAFGVALALLSIKAIYLQADATNVNNIVFGDHADPVQLWFDTATDTEAVKPGGMSVHADPAGWPVTATTHDGIKLANSGSGSAVTGTLVIIGSTTNP